MQETPVQFLGREDPWRRDRLPTPGFLGFPCGSAGKESAYNAGDLGSIPGLGRSPGEGKGYPLQDSCLKNSMAIQSMELQRVRHDWVTWKKKTNRFMGNFKVYALFVCLCKKNHLKLKCCVFFKAQEHNSKWLLFSQELNSIWPEKKKSDIDNK